MAIGLFDSEIGAYSVPTAEEIHDLAMWLRMNKADLESMLTAGNAARPRHLTFPALITNWQEFAPNRWLYAWEQARWDWDTLKWIPDTVLLTSAPNRTDRPFTPGGGGGGQVRPPSNPPTQLLVRASSVDGDEFAYGALNLAESENTATIVEGMDISLPSYTNCNLEPKPVQGVVLMHASADMPRMNGTQVQSRVWFERSLRHGKVGEP